MSALKQTAGKDTGEETQRQKGGLENQFVLTGGTLARALSGEPPMTQVTLQQPHLHIYRMTDNVPQEQRLS